MPQLSRTLARFVHSTQFEDLPDAVLHASKRAILDTLGVAIAAREDECSSVVLGYVRGTAFAAAKSCIIAETIRVSPEMAALANGTLAHLLDYDDSHNPMGGHPSAPVLSAALAVADHVGCSGKDLLLAFVVGFEIETKLARAVNPRLYERGWHPTSVLSVFGATAAASKLLGLDEDETAHALSMSASMCCGMRGNFATLTKPLHVGRAAQSGVQAAMLAGCGHTANLDVFEASMGYLDLYCSPRAEDWKLGEVEGKLGKPWEIVSPGTTVKPYPCGGSTHSTIDGHLLLRQRLGVSAGDIAKVRNGIHARRLGHTSRPRVVHGIEGKFSNQYVTALAWLKGEILIEHFVDSVACDPELVALMSKVETYAEPGISASPQETHALVEVTLRNGKVEQERITRRRGSPANPLTDDELVAKFKDCAQRVFDRERVERLLDCIWSLDGSLGAGRLTALLSGKALPDAAVSTGVA